jgi:hypothetical protein
MLTPLKQFVCDVCGKIIENPEAGYVVWDTDDQMLAYGIKVIHHAKCDDRSCGRSNDLPHFLGEDGLAYLLSFLSAGPIAMKEKFGAGKGRVKNLDEFTDFFRRCQTPYYEEIRQYFDDPVVIDRLSDHNEYSPYVISTMQKLIDEAAERRRKRLEGES